MSISYSFRLKSHPNKLLWEHLRDVGNLSKEIVLRKEIEDKVIFSDIAYLVGISHDFAKATTYFQAVLNKQEERTEMAYHGFLSSIFSYFAVREYIEIKGRRDLDFIPILVWVAVLKHHGNIQNLKGTGGELEKLKDLNDVKAQIKDIRQNSMSELQEIYKDLSIVNIDWDYFFSNFEGIAKELRLKGKKLVMSKNQENYFILLFFYSVLLDADKLDASGIEKVPRRVSIPSELVDNYKESRFGDEVRGINVIRDRAYTEVIESLDDLDIKEDKILSIELPTGCGKTLTAFSFALKLREIVKNRLGFKPKIVYSLPFLSIIDQNAEVLSEVLIGNEGIDWRDLENMESGRKKEMLSEIPSNLILKHHYLSDITYRVKDGSREEIEDVEKSLLLIEGWHSEVVITTFIQLFHSLITNRNRAARKFHNMLNSVIILDEIQSIPYEYWLLVNNALKHIAEKYNCWIILMTATLPLIYGKEEIKPLIEDKHTYFEKLNRVRYNFDLKDKKFEEFKEEILGEVLESNKDLMVVLNTVESSKELYKFLKDGLEGAHGEGRVTGEGILEFDNDNLVLFNLSTHIIPIHRLKRISRVKQEQKRKIIVTTQIVEAGVDISVDLVYRDLAPLDCIIQTAGRCNRNNEGQKGIVNIVNLKDDNGRPFYHIYSSTLINITKDVLGESGSLEDSFEEKEFITTFLPKYYDYISERGKKEPSERIIEVLKSLNFSDIKDFKLIEEEPWKIDVFVDVDSQSNQIWRKYEEVVGKVDSFERRREFLKMKKNFYDYVISVDERKMETTLTEYGIGYINLNNMDTYDLETGFIQRKNALIY